MADGLKSIALALMTESVDEIIYRKIESLKSRFDKGKDYPQKKGMLNDIMAFAKSHGFIGTLTSDNIQSIFNDLEQNGILYKYFFNDLQKKYSEYFNIDIPKLPQYFKYYVNNYDIYRLIFQKDSLFSDLPIAEQKSNSELAVQIESDLKEHFLKFNEYLGYFEENKISQEWGSIKKFINVIIYKYLEEQYKNNLLVEDIEKSSSFQERMVELSYKILVLFGDLNSEFDIKNISQKYDKFTKDFTAFSRGFQKQQISGLEFLESLIMPTKKDYLLDNLFKWQTVIQKIGYEGLQDLASYPEVDLSNLDITKGTAKVKQDFNEILINYKYPYTIANEKIHQFKLDCLKYGVESSTFKVAMDWLEELNYKIPKDLDYLPDVQVEYNVDQGKYVLLKLPVDDWRALILGKISNCCQSIDGASSQCVKDGMSFKNNGFYVLMYVRDKNKPVNLKTDEIVGQSYAWYSTQGSLVFDSWENTYPARDDKIIPEILKDFSKKAIEKYPDITRVMIGLGGGTPQSYKQDIMESYWETIIPDNSMIEGTTYTDSDFQAVIYGNEEYLKYLDIIKKYLPSAKPFNLNLAKHLIDSGEIDKIPQDLLKFIILLPNAYKIGYNLCLLNNETINLPNIITNIQYFFNNYKNNSQIKFLIDTLTKGILQDDIIGMDDIAKISEKDIELAELITSEPVLKLLKTKVIKFDEFIQLARNDSEITKLITQPSFLELLAQNLVTVEEFIDIAIDNIEVAKLSLTTNAVKLYTEHNIDFNSFIDMAKENIGLAKSSIQLGFLYLYEGKMITFSQIIDTAKDNVGIAEFAISQRAYISYINDLFNFDEIVTLAKNNKKYTIFLLDNIETIKNIFNKKDEWLIKLEKYFIENPKMAELILKTYNRLHKEMDFDTITESLTQKIDESQKPKKPRI